MWTPDGVDLKATDGRTGWQALSLLILVIWV